MYWKKNKKFENKRTQKQWHITESKQMKGKKTLENGMGEICLKLQREKKK